MIALTTFEGLLTLENGLATAATLSLSEDNTLELRAGGIKLGSWSASEWTIVPNGSSYSIRVEAETLTFIPNDRDAFRTRMTEAIESTVETLVGAIDTPLKSVADLVEAAAPPDTPEPVELPTIAEQIVADAEEVHEGEDDEQEPGLDLRRLAGVGLGAVALIVVLVVSILTLVSEEPAPADTGLAGPDTTVTTPAATSPTSAVASPTSTVATTLPPETPSIFTMSPKGFVATWNSVARRFRVPVQLPPEFAEGLGVHEFSPYLSLEVAGSDGVELIRFVGDPAGDPASDQIMLATLGVTISVVEPELDARGRADLLAQLGLDIRDPILPGLLSTLERDGARYTLVFDDEADVLVFEVRPIP